MTTPAAPTREPDVIPLDVDMTNIGEREFVPVGQPVYTIFIAELAAGTTRLELQINKRWVRLQQGDSVDLGDCTPTREGIMIRTQPALAGLFSQIIIGGTPATVIERA